jgi:hypothetical protein
MVCLNFTFYMDYRAHSSYQSSLNFRIEKDTFGELHVPADKYWGAQTQRWDLSNVVATYINRMSIDHCRILILVGRPSAFRHLLLRHLVCLRRQLLLSILGMEWIQKLDKLFKRLQTMSVTVFSHSRVDVYLFL